MAHIQQTEVWLNMPKHSKKYSLRLFSPAINKPLHFCREPNVHVILTRYTIEMIRQRLHAASQALKNAEGIVLFARRMRALLAFVCAFYVGGNAQVLSEAEHAIVERVEANSDESIDFLEKTVNINSGTMNPSGVQAVGQVYQ